MAAIRQLYTNAVVGGGNRVGERRDRRQARRAGGAAGRRRARRRGHAEPDRARRADGDAQLRQLHVHPHGERLDPDDGPGARARHRRTPAAGVRPVGADARHRQGPHAEGNPATSRSKLTDAGVRDHAAAIRSTAPRSCGARRRCRSSRRSSPSSITCGWTAPAIPSAPSAARSTSAR